MKKMSEKNKQVLMWSFWSVVAFLTVHILIDIDGFLIDHVGLSNADIISDFYQAELTKTVLWAIPIGIGSISLAHLINKKCHPKKITRI